MHYLRLLYPFSGLGGGGQKLAVVRLLRYCSHIISKIGLMNKSYIFINYNFNAHSELELAAEAAIRDLE